MGIRLIRCKHCNHVNKFGARTCSYCFKPTSFLNRILFWVILAVGLGMVVYLNTDWMGR
ncbi:hypothetical protein TRP8649_02916 [Pelagimonas phthalicica]|uniref:Uncharacterized protein n=1 Tax=Pelagimonas phthalicica TaxID=1037362 RepID=A0A238JDN1_9RHOB|nr:hypothetical protein CLV87_2917 [Pelagimonas phthalicica]SMX28790.1 hypothetical protein TRP8649_02916 [Pelagimonas phthalicica]